MHHSVETPEGHRDARYWTISEVAQRRVISGRVAWSESSILDVLEDERVSTVRIVESVARGRIFEARALPTDLAREEGETDDHPGYEAWRLEDEPDT